MIISETWQWLVDGSHWSGTDGILHRLEQHLVYTIITLLIASLIALPLGAWIAHTGHGRWLVSIANALRAIPSLGLLCVIGMWASGKVSGDLALTGPSIVVLVVLAIPPLLAGAYSGVTEVDPAARDAAKGMGMTGTQVFGKVELPCAMPLIFSGLRSATLQVIATATIAAAISVGGLGRFLIDGLANSDYIQMAGGSVLVAALALVADGILAALQRLVVPGGLRSASTSRRKRRAAAAEAQSAHAA